jgi:two-component system chemotaxis sensor kinase CheA
MNLDQAQQTFIIESRELLASMEDALLHLEGAADDQEAVSAIFRAAHTIKGSAGLFGFDDIVAFTHVTESVLNQVRDGEVAIDGDLIALLLACADHIGALVARADTGEAAPDAALERIGGDLLERLRLHLGEAAPAAKKTLPAEAAEKVQACGGGQVSSDTWHISLRFGRDVLRNGMDPLSFVRYLGTLGEVTAIVPLFNAMPAAEEMDPESCYMGLEINLRSDADKEAIANVFEFVREDSLIRILPPHSKVSEYLRLIEDLREDKVLLGDILVASGAITQDELEQGLAEQKTQQAQHGEANEVVRPAQPLGEILIEQHVVQKEVVDAALEKQKKVKESKANEQRFIRVQADKLDKLINLVGELVIAGDGASLHAQRLKDEGLLETSSIIHRLVADIRDSALQLRMVQIGETFSRFHRVVHDVSKEIGKGIDLVVSGKETELDKAVVEKIGDPLMHLVRNSMDHGIEPAEVRAARGKPVRGTLRLNAYHDSGSIVIEVADDGGGLNRERILAKATERGLVQPGQELADADVYKLIFEPGFSTAEQVTNLSGRGVGMDVVRRNIEALRGAVEIRSSEGEGTTIAIRLPLTLAIIDGFLMGVNGGSYVVPLDSVVECMNYPAAAARLDRGRNYINLRGEILPYIRLREVFDGHAGSGKNGRPALNGKLHAEEHIVVVQFAGSKAGLVVDRLLGEFQTVIKPMAKLFGKLPGISGSTILGSGDVALILDVPALIQQAVNSETHRVSLAHQPRPALTH